MVLWCLAADSVIASSVTLIDQESLWSYKVVDTSTDLYYRWPKSTDTILGVVTWSVVDLTGNVASRSQVGLMLLFGAGLAGPVAAKRCRKDAKAE